MDYSATTNQNHMILLDGSRVGDNFPTYIIAEIGQNHNGDIKIAKLLIEMANRCGANAVKFQKRDITSELTTEAYYKLYDNPNSFGKTYGEHREYLELNEDENRELKAFCDEIGITFFCTPCDLPSLEIMERLCVPFYKVASRDLTNIPLLIELSKINKPVIISTGMAAYEDIEDALDVLKLHTDDIIIMQCTSEYPCKLENVNLRVIQTLREKYGYLVGFSDHTSGIIISAVASTFGACVIEKHITLDRSMKGTDHPGALQEAGLMKLVEYIRAINKAIGNPEKIFNPAVIASKNKLARSLTTKIPIPKGSILKEDMICLKSPGSGLLWREKGQVLGKKALFNIEANVTIARGDFE
jgi:sialic acid synthase